MFIHLLNTHLTIKSETRFFIHWTHFVSSAVNIFAITLKCHRLLPYLDIQNKKSIFRYSLILALQVGLEPTTFRLTAERSTNWAIGEYKNLATSYLPSRVTRKYFQHQRAWLLCSEWEQVFPLRYYHQKIFMYLLYCLNLKLSIQFKIFFSYF